MRAAKAGNAQEQEQPAVSKAAKKNAKRKEKRKQQQTSGNKDLNSLADGVSLVKLSSERQSMQDVENLSKEDIEKKLKKLRKKLRHTEELEDKINKGEIKNPEKEQLEKVQNKHKVIEEIEDLELELED